MKKQVAILFAIFCGLNAFGQDEEFSKSNNGLIYSDVTIGQLKFIVDSLNLKHKVCELNKIYRASSQAKAHFVSIEKMNVKAAKQDIASGISFEDFTKKYSKAAIEWDLLVVKHRYKNYDEKDVISFRSLELDSQPDHNLEFDDNLSYYERPLTGTWIINYSSKTSYSSELLEAFYFLNEFTQPTLPKQYARMVQYADCMVDTTTQIFYSNHYSSRFNFDKKGTPNIRIFLAYANKLTGNKNSGSIYNRTKLNIAGCNDSIKNTVTNVNPPDEKFSRLLNAALKEAKEKGGSDDEFEEYVALYYSKKAALELKRHRRVIGNCSQDQGPRIHALNIAKLSAEAVSWEVFLRSHLDIMNDRFDRVSDGSYAWQGRKTYIKELEVLDINVPDLLLGITLRVENAGDNHYYGNIGRLGRALAETQQASVIELRMLQMIGDDELDDYNRILVYYLYLNYNHYVDNKEKQAQNKIKLTAAVKKLPRYLADKIKIES